MSLEQAILEAIRELPPEKQREILDHATQLRELESKPKKPRVSARGLWKDLNIQLSDEDIAEARREAWKNFPRDF